MAIGPLAATLSPQRDATFQIQGGARKAGEGENGIRTASDDVLDETVRAALEAPHLTRPLRPQGRRGGG
jgi:hypothetical protein